MSVFHKKAADLSRISEYNKAIFNKEYDIVVCSAFKNDYYPVYDTLIGALYYNKDISVDDLSKNPEIDLKSFGGWLSNETNTSFKRIACVEIFSMIDLYLNQHSYIIFHY